MRGFLVFKAVALIVLFSSITQAANWTAKDFANLRMAIETEIQNNLRFQLDVDAPASEPESRAIFYAQMASVPALDQVLGISAERYANLRQGNSNLSSDELRKLLSFVKAKKEELTRKLEKHFMGYRPPPSQDMLLTVEGLKAFSALNIAFFGGGMLGSGLIPWDSQVGQVLAPIAIVASAYVTLKAVFVYEKLARRDEQEAKYKQFITEKAKLARLPQDLIATSFILDRLIQRGVRCELSFSFKGS